MPFIFRNKGPSGYLIRINLAHQVPFILVLHESYIPKPDCTISSTGEDAKVSMIEYKGIQLFVMSFKLHKGLSGSYIIKFYNAIAAA